MSESLKVVLLIVKDFKDLLITAENVFCLENKKYRYYYALTIGHNFLVYFVYYQPLKEKKIEGYIGLDKDNNLLFSNVPKIGYKKIIYLVWDSVASKCLRRG